MIELDIPTYGQLRLTHLLIDFNGTVAKDGTLLDEARELLPALARLLEVRLVSADTYGTVRQVTQGLGVAVVTLGSGLEEAHQKAELVASLGARNVVAIGNGANDAEMLKRAAVGICILGDEGAASTALQSADVVVSSFPDAAGLLLHPKRLLATLRR